AGPFPVPALGVLPNFQRHAGRAGGLLKSQRPALVRLGQHLAAVTADVGLGQKRDRTEILFGGDVFGSDARSGESLAVIGNGRGRVAEQPSECGALPGADHRRRVELPAGQFALEHGRARVFVSRPQRVDQPAAGAVEQSHSSASSSMSESSNAGSAIASAARALQIATPTAVNAQYQSQLKRYRLWLNI